MQSPGDDVYVGQYVGQREVEITPTLVDQYVDAVDDHNYGDARSGAPVAPALLLHSEVYRNLSWYLPRLYGNLHARQEWDLFSPMLIGDTVTTRSQVTDRYVKRDREYVVNETACYAADGSMLHRGRTHQSFLIDSQTSGIVVNKEREKQSSRRFEIGEGIVLEEIAGKVKDITLDMCLKFSGPHKNYHNDPEEARKLGFPDIVVQGMMPLCFISEMMTDRFETGWFSGGKMNVALVNVVWGADRLICRGILREIAPEGRRARGHLDVWCEKEDRTKVVVGTASALMDPPGQR